MNIEEVHIGHRGDVVPIAAMKPWHLVNTFYAHLKEGNKIMKVYCDLVAFPYGNIVGESVLHWISPETEKIANAVRERITTRTIVMDDPDMVIMRNDLLRVNGVLMYLTKRIKYALWHNGEIPTGTWSDEDDELNGCSNITETSHPKETI